MPKMLHVISHRFAAARKPRHENTELSGTLSPDYPPLGLHASLPHVATEMMLRGDLSDPVNCESREYTPPTPRKPQWYKDSGLQLASSIHLVLQIL